MVHTACSTNNQKLQGQGLPWITAYNDVLMGCKWDTIQYLLYWNRWIYTTSYSTTIIHLFLFGHMGSSFVLPSSTNAQEETMAGCYSICPCQCWPRAWVYFVVKTFTQTWDYVADVDYRDHCLNIVSHWIDTTLL